MNAIATRPSSRGTVLLHLSPSEVVGSDGEKGGNSLSQRLDWKNTFFPILTMRMARELSFNSLLPGAGNGLISRHQNAKIKRGVGKKNGGLMVFPSTHFFPCYCRWQKAWFVPSLLVLAKLNNPLGTGRRETGGAQALCCAATATDAAAALFSISASLSAGVTQMSASRGAHARASRAKHLVWRGYCSLSLLSTCAFRRPLEDHCESAPHLGRWRRCCHTKRETFTLPPFFYLFLCRYIYIYTGEQQTTY